MKRTHKKTALRIKFGEIVRQRRKSLGYSQERLAFETGLHRTYIGSVERGERNVSLENISVLAIALKCLPGELIPSISDSD